MMRQIYPYAKAVCLGFVLALAAVAGSALAGMSDADWTHCRAVGVAEKATVDNDVVYMQSDAAKGQFTDAEVEQMKHLSQSVQDNYLANFDETKPIDESAVAVWSVKDHAEIETELNHCYDMMEADIDESIKAINDLLGDSASSSSAASSSSSQE